MLRGITQVPLLSVESADLYNLQRVDESTMTTRSESAEACLDLCEQKQQRSCMAWTWDEEKKVCHTSPWLIVGNDQSESKYSGLNIGLVKRLVRECQQI